MNAQTLPKRTTVLATPLLVLAVLLVAGLPTPAQAQSSGHNDFALFARPFPFNRMMVDPWTDGLWFATDVGAYLHTPDSVGLTTVTVRDGLPSGVIYDIAPTANELWFGTFRGVAVMDRATGTFTQVKKEDGQALGFNARTVRIWGDEAWIAGGFGGLWRADLETKVAKEVMNPQNGSRFSDQVYDFWRDGDEAFISVTGYGLVRWDMASGDSDLIKQNLLVPTPLYFRIHVTPQYVFVSTHGDGLVRYNRSSQKTVEFVSPQTTNSPAVTSLAQIGSDLYMGAASGVTRYDTQRQVWKNWQDVPGRGAVDVAVYRGDVYAATRNGIVAKLERGIDGWVDANWWSVRNTPEHNVIRDCDWDGERLLFSTGGGGANFFDPATLRWARAGSEPTDQGRPRDILILATASDAKERWYAHAKGLSRQDRATGLWTDFRTDGRDPDISISRYALDVEITATDVWAASQSVPPSKQTNNRWEPGNLARMDRATGAWTYYGPADGVSNENVTVSRPDGRSVWIGTMLGGLDELRLDDHSIRHVFPKDGSLVTVTSVLPLDDAILVGTAGGLYALDRATLAPREVAAFRGMAVDSLGHDGQDVWVGTHTGLFHFDPRTDAAQFLPRGTVIVTVYCTVAHDGVLYVGTTAGIERLDLATRRWLPSMQLMGAPPTPPAQDVGPTTIQITSPSAGSPAKPGDTLVVAGQASGPAGALVEVRHGDGPWQPATGVESWTAQIPISNQPPGPSDVTARLRSDARTLVQASVSVDIVWPSEDAVATAASGTRFYHRPVLEAFQGEGVDFEVFAVPSANDATATVEIVADDGTKVQLPLAAVRDDLLLATWPATLGSYSYTVRVSTDAESFVFPRPAENTGDRYGLVVHASDSGVTFDVPASSMKLDPTGPSTVRLAITNNLALAADLHLLFGGPAGSLVSAPSSIHLEPHVPTSVTLVIAPPAGTRLPPSIELSVRGTVDDLPSVEPFAKFMFTTAASNSAVVGEANEAPVQQKESEDHSTAGPAFGASVFAALVAVAWACRRRAP